LEEVVGGFGFEGDVANLVDDDQWVAAEAAELGLQPSSVMGGGESIDPLGGGGEQDPVTTKPDKRIRNAFPYRAPTRRTSYYAAEW
jgi:hypothetical protein